MKNPAYTLPMRMPLWLRCAFVAMALAAGHRSARAQSALTEFEWPEFEFLESVHPSEISTRWSRGFWKHRYYGPSKYGAGFANLARYHAYRLPVAPPIYHADHGYHYPTWRQAAVAVRHHYGAIEWDSAPGIVPSQTPTPAETPPPVEVPDDGGYSPKPAATPELPAPRPEATQTPVPLRGPIQRTSFTDADAGFRKLHAREESRKEPLPPRKPPQQRPAPRPFPSPTPEKPARPQPLPFPAADEESMDDDPEPPLSPKPPREAPLELPAMEPESAALLDMNTADARPALRRRSASLWRGD